jgi:hypothetical protein
MRGVARDQGRKRRSWGDSNGLAILDDLELCPAGTCDTCDTCDTCALLGGEGDDLIRAARRQMGLGDQGGHG